MELVTGALVLDGAAFAGLEARPDGTRLAIGVLALAGLSSALGQSVVLFANRVRPLRFAASLLVAALLFVLTTLLWSASLWALADWLFARPRPFGSAVRAVGLGHAPQLAAFVVLTPYFGSGLGAFLSVWTFLAVGVGAREAFGLSLSAALGCAGLGWLMLQVVQRTVGRPVVHAARALRDWTAGRPLRPLERLGRSEDRTGDRR